MGTLVPEDFPLEQLADDAERSVVEAMRDGLSSNWHIVPDIGMRDEIDRQTDIVLVHPEMGVVLLEVKSHQMSIREGQWYGELGTPLQKSPIKQAKDNAYELRKRLRHEVDGLEQIRVDYGIALPNTRELVGALPPDIKPVQVLTSVELADVNDAIEDLVFERSWNRSFTPEQFEAIISMLRPDVDFAWDPDARATTTRDRLLEMCDTQIAVARSLAMNRRVCVRGGAGTGKTRLAMAVAQDAWHEGDHVLVTCYNDPLALALREALPVDEDLVIGAFFRVALALPGMPHLEIPADANQNWWDTVATGHLHTHWPNIAERFDTIIIDEAQDLSVAWLAQLESLLAPEGKRRIFMVADEDQGLYERGFRFPDADDGWTHAELVYNCRNAQPIARILRHRRGGPAAPSAAPGHANPASWNNRNTSNVSRAASPVRQAHATHAGRLRLAATEGRGGWEGIGRPAGGSAVASTQKNTRATRSLRAGYPRAPSYSRYHRPQSGSTGLWSLAFTALWRRTVH